jgi:1-phosphofructokinase family hexose kinase
VNRATIAEPLPGGKAAHVAMASLALGLRPVWTSMIGGAVGEECVRSLSALGIETAALPSNSQTRVNLELVEDSGRITEVLEPGIAASPDEQAAFIAHCTKAFNNEWRGAIVVLSGSLPHGAPGDFYARLVYAAHAAGLKTFVDTSGEWLLGVLEAKPDFVKINASEAQALKWHAPQRSWALAAAQELMRRGAISAAITLGKDGAVWCESSAGPAWFARPPQIDCISSVGSGDCMLAGFVYSAVTGLPGKEALAFATACGAANCFAEYTARISRQNVENLRSQIATSSIQNEL